MMEGTGSASRAPARAGFTLIEMLAVTALTAVLMLYAVNVYREITRATEAATAQTREDRRAAGILDRISRDLEGAVLVKKPEEVDPLAHPWLFLAEDRGGIEGADHLKFITRSRISRSGALHESDLEVVAYVAREGEGGGLELLRWSSPRLPEELDRSFPEGDLEGAVVFAEDLESFGVRFLNSAGEWTTEWDSSTLLESSELPLAAQVWVSVLPENAAEIDPSEVEEPVLYERRVVLPVRPLDLEALLGTGKTDEGGGCSTGPTLRECVSGNDAFEDLLEAQPDLRALIEEFGDQCYSTHAAAFGMSGECP